MTRLPRLSHHQLHRLPRRHRTRRQRHRRQRRTIMTTTMMLSWVRRICSSGHSIAQSQAGKMILNKQPNLLKKPTI